MLWIPSTIPEDRRDENFGLREGRGEKAAFCESPEGYGKVESSSRNSRCKGAKQGSEPRPSPRDAMNGNITKGE